MDYVQLAVIGSSIGTASIVLIYLYLYALYGQHYMGIWAAGWLILLARYMVFDLGLLPWKQSALGMTAYQMMIIISMFLFVWATYLYTNKPFNKWWLYGTATIAVISLTMNSLSLPLIYKLMPSIYFGCFVCIWIGLIFIHNFQLKGTGHLITGYSYIAWSLLNLVAPISLSGTWFLPWAHALGGIFRLFIAIGTLMVYLENTRTDLVNKETQYRLLAENAADTIYFYQIHPTAKLQYINPTVHLLTGYAPEEFYKNNNLVLDLLHADDRRLAEDFIRDFPRSIESPLTLRLVRKDKTTLWIEQKCTPIYDKYGNFTALQGIIRDVTPRKDLEKITSMLDRMTMVGSMAATVAHEIRNPMTTVRGYLQLMGRKDKYQTDKQKFELMIEEIDRANAIISEYLSLSREKFSNFGMCSLNTIIEALYPLLQADATAAAVSVTLDLNTIPELLLDENEIRQLLLNLVRNGIEAMPAGGRLVIKTAFEAGKAVLSVSDQGPGIPAPILENLGTPFITTKNTGTGLGIPICYQIAHRHNATIKIHTSSEGTTFLVYFNPPAA
ncbi:ATP-binding protein [Sporomusa termitida]|uniref:histidine kinase n=1 Tax=Sporomusa termitida TaxID=2377 RepID=A0A517DQ40_9FIRM|nr:ATP-binding protein [Sporomusa termitida]QDR79485.1 Adaptive-response sensory-kinase SasA [Sporomusa termitida]